MSTLSTAMEAIRELARHARREAEAVAAAGGDLDRVLTAACAARGLKVETDRDGRLRGDEGRLLRANGGHGGRILVDGTLDGPARRHVVAHEIGHYDLHDRRQEVRATAYVVAGVSRFDPGYSPRSLVEAQAEAYAAEFLCPAADLPTEPEAFRRFAEGSGLAGDLVRGQATLRLRPPRRGDAMKAPPPPDLDQRRALAAAGPMTIVAGAPGTGRTTLVAMRAIRLIELGVPASAIAVLAHSDQAAERLRSAIATVRPRDAATLWCGTQTALMFEIVACHAARVGLPVGFGVLDPAGTRTLIERGRGGLPAGAAFDPGALASEIGRRRRGQAVGRHRPGGPTPPGIIDLAERIYAKAKADAACADRSDLFAKAAHLAILTPDVAARFSRRFEHVLVDDAQDLRADCVDVLKALGLAGSSLFCTASTMATLRGFDGASPDAAASLAAVGRARRFELKHPHRGPVPMASPRRAGAKASSGGTRAQGRADREAAELAAAVRLHERQGTRMGRQAILVRSHARGKALKARLAALGVAALHFGEFCERGEVRDLCAIADLDDAHGTTAAAALRHLASGGSYRATRGDVALVIAHAIAAGHDVIQALDASATIRGLTTDGRRGLSRLGGELRGLRPREHTWTALTTWLFERSDYLASGAQPEPEESLRRLAIAHVLDVCAMQDDLGEHGGRALMARLRSAGALDVVGGLSSIDLDRYDVDAVRIMTIHAAQGVEFEAVHIQHATMRDLLEGAARGDGAAFAIATTRVAAVPAAPSAGATTGDDIAARGRSASTRAA